jgi:CheY-like chemotaxis protein
MAEAFEAEGWRTAIGRVPMLPGGDLEVHAFLDENDADAVVFDVVQPFDDYLETLRAVRRARHGSDRPIVVTTTSKKALAKQGLTKAVELREPEDLPDVTDAVRVALEAVRPR